MFCGRFSFLTEPLLAMEPSHEEVSVVAEVVNADTSENPVESEDEEEVLRLKLSGRGKTTIAEGSATSKVKGKGKGKGKGTIAEGPVVMRRKGKAGGKGVEWIEDDVSSHESETGGVFSFLSIFLVSYLFVRSICLGFNRDLL